MHPLDPLSVGCDRRCGGSSKIITVVFLSSAYEVSKQDGRQASVDHGTRRACGYPAAGDGPAHGQTSIDPPGRQAVSGKDACSDPVQVNGSES
jgi:hypothetical protein